MHDYDDLTRRLADLVVGFGANVQPGQLVGVTSYLRKEALTRQIARAAYERGASFVDVLYFDQLLKRERLLGGDPETFSYIPPWMVDRLRYLSNERAARISLSGPQAPHALDDVPADRSGADLLPFLPEVGHIVNLHTTNWSAVPAPTQGWAELVYPDDDRQRRSTASGERSRAFAVSTSPIPWQRGRPAWVSSIAAPRRCPSEGSTRSTSTGRGRTSRSGSFSHPSGKPRSS